VAQAEALTKEKSGLSSPWSLIRWLMTILINFTSFLVDLQEVAEMGVCAGRTQGKKIPKRCI
jgi:hypothetical protein